jgi:hypothetical protein
MPRGTGGGVDADQAPREGDSSSTPGPCATAKQPDDVTPGHVAVLVTSSTHHFIYLQIPGTHGPHRHHASRQNSREVREPHAPNRKDSILYQGDVPLVEEINEQDVDEMFGGTLWEFSVLTATPFISQPLGNKGHVCTLTKECQASCN